MQKVQKYIRYNKFSIIKLYKEEKNLRKIKLAVIFGGMSTEHDVSIVSGASVLNNLDKEKYEIFPIYIDAQGIWKKYVGNIETLSTLHVGDKIDNIEKIENPMEYLKKCDIAFSSFTWTIWRRRNNTRIA